MSIESVLRSIEKKCSDAKKEVDSYEELKPKYTKAPRRGLERLKIFEGRKPYGEGTRRR